MGFIMSLHIALLRKLLKTTLEMTNMRFFAGMRVQMNFQSRSPGKSRTAFITTIRPDIVVSFDVVL